MKYVVAFCGLLLLLYFGYSWLTTPKTETLKAKQLKADEYEKIQPLPSTTSLEKKQETIEPMPTPNSVKIKIPVILYHYVEYVQDKKDKLRQLLNIEPNILEDQLKSVKKNEYQTYFSSDIVSLIKSGNSSKSIILSFDDGYQDFYTYVFPLLKKYNCKATVYVISEFIDKKDYLTKNQLIELSQSPLIEIGAHTKTHTKLSKLSSEQQLAQIQGSKNELEQIINKPVTSFAYPFGDYNQTSIDEVQKAGYTNAVTVIPGSYQSEQNIFTIQRYRAGNFIKKDFIQEINALKY